MLYDENIPILDTDADHSQYQIIQEQFSYYDPTYVFNGLVEDRRIYIEKAFALSERFLDDDFKAQIKIKGNFFSRLWELQLCSILLDKGYELIPPPRNKKQTARPDFCINQIDGSKIWIEAVCPQQGAIGSKPEITPGQIYTRSSNIFDELQLSAPRIISSTLAKYKKLDSYKQNPDFKDGDKFILAINTELINHHEPSDMAKELVLYGMGLTFIKQTGESGRYFHDEILDTGGGKNVPVPTALFHKKEYEHISAVISSSRWFDFGNEFIDDMAGGINTYFNHNALNKLDHKYINFGTKHTMVCEGEYCTLEHFLSPREGSDSDKVK